MSGYERLTNPIRELEEFPDIDIETTLRDVNALFKPYIFVQKAKKGIRLWTSCCNREEQWETFPKLATPAHISVWYGAHNYAAICPFCGRSVTVKETRYIRVRNSLEEYHPVFLLAEKDGNVYARGLWARKIYEGDFAAPPRFLIRYAYKFTPGKVTEWAWGVYSGLQRNVIRPGYTPGKGAPYEAFYETGGRRTLYSVFGADCIDSSFLKYAQWREYLGKEKSHLHLMNYLCLASMYPRKVEMLMKSGLREIVEDYVRGWRKNARILNWDEEDLLKSFGLSRQEWNAFRESGAAPAVIAPYKALRKAKLETPFSILKTVTDEGLDAEHLARVCKKHHEKPERVMRYLDKFTGSRCHGGYFGLRAAFKLWTDYLNMAAALQMDLKEHNVLFPKNLELAHNKAAAEQNRLLKIAERESAAAEAAKHAEQLHKWRLKYNFANDTHHIRIAEDRMEIIDEGAALKHCVGGYAGQHMNGATTILFLRRNDTPEASLYTIEMQGNRMMQIHGYRNEMRNGVRIAPDPRDVMKEFLDEWMDWLKRGSPRTKTGEPKRRRKKKESAA